MKAKSLRGFWVLENDAEVFIRYLDKQIKELEIQIEEQIRYSTEYEETLTNLSILKELRYHLEK